MLLLNFLHVKSVQYYQKQWAYDGVGNISINSAILCLVSFLPSQDRKGPSFSSSKTKKLKRGIRSIHSFHPSNLSPQPCSCQKPSQPCNAKLFVPQNPQSSPPVSSHAMHCTTETQVLPSYHTTQPHSHKQRNKPRQLVIASPSLHFTPFIHHAKSIRLKTVP